MKRSKDALTIIEEFIDICKANKEKTAFICNGRKVSFKALLSDLFRTVSLMKESGLQPGDKVLVFVRPSYELYLLMFAGLYYGVNLIVLDSYKSPKRIRRVLSEEQVSFVICDSLTFLFKALVGREQKWVKIGEYERQTDTPCAASTDLTSTLLTTYTSGTTGEPKPIKRSLTDLRRQVDVVTDNLPIGKNDVVFSKLPIYTLFIVFSGLTCVISKRIGKEELKKHKVTAVLAPIAELVRLKEPLPFIKKVMLGGATLYPRELDILFSLFPGADMEYIYGSSECVLMARAGLRHFAKEFAFEKKISDIELSIVDPDENGVGRICVRGEVVLSDTKTRIGDDIGFLDDKGLHIVGRRRFSSVGRYNYLLDRQLLTLHPEIKKGFSLIYKEKAYFCYEGRLRSPMSDDVTYIHFYRLPMDLKHKTKLNYQKALGRIIKKFGV